MMKSKKNNSNPTYFAFIYGKMMSLIYELSVSSNHYKNFGLSNNGFDLMKVIRSGISDVQNFLHLNDKTIDNDTIRKATYLTVSLEILSKKYCLEKYFEDLFISKVRDIAFTDIVSRKEKELVSRSYDYILTLIVESLIGKEFAFVDIFNKHLLNNSFLFGEIKQFYIFYSAYLFSMTKIDYVDQQIKDYVLKMSTNDNGKWKNRLKENIRLMGLDELLDLLIKMVEIFKYHHGVWCWPYHEEMYTVSNYEMSLEYIFNVWLDIVRYCSLYNEHSYHDASLKTATIVEFFKNDATALDTLHRCIIEKFDSPDMKANKTTIGYIEFLFDCNYESKQFEDSNIIKALLDKIEEKEKEECSQIDYDNELSGASKMLLEQSKSAIESLNFSAFNKDKTCIETTIHLILDLDTIQDSNRAYRSLFESNIIRTVSSMIRSKVQDRVFTKQMLYEQSGDFIFTPSTKYTLYNLGFEDSKILSLTFEDRRKYMDEARIAFKENSIDFGAKIDTNSVQLTELDDTTINNIIEGRYKTSPGVYKYFKYEGSVQRFSCSYDEIYEIIKNRYRNATITICYSVNSFEIENIYSVKKAEV